MFEHEERITPHRYYQDFYSTYANYIGRYHFAARFIGPASRVLDLGCGCGYGSARLAESLNRIVFGLDRSSEGVAYGRAHYPSGRLQFLRGDATRLPLGSATMDAVVAMEMIEHVEDAKGVLAEAWRVLRPAGLLLVSTPNRLVTGIGDKPSNPYHVREYTPDEFRSLLAKVFEEVSLYGQDLTPSARTAQENMARIWQNLALIPVLYDQVHALQARLEMDERLTGLSLLRRLKRLLGRHRKTGLAPPPRTEDLHAAFRHAEALVTSVTDFDFQPYQLDRATILVGVCRK
jgi:ubiquinone/menaquinone biosynthesis C-methylase UbiE